MKVTSQWPSLVRSLMTERGISERKLAPAANVNRSTLRRFLSGKSTNMPVEHLERILAVFGYELDAVFAVPDEKEDDACLTPHHASANVARPFLAAPVAHVS